MIQREDIAEALSLRILTHNVRYAITSPSKNERSWPEQFSLIARQFRYHTRFLMVLAIVPALALVPFVSKKRCTVSYGTFWSTWMIFFILRTLIMLKNFPVGRYGPL